MLEEILARSGGYGRIYGYPLRAFVVLPSLQNDHRMASLSSAGYYKFALHMSEVAKSASLQGRLRSLLEPRLCTPQVTKCGHLLRADHSKSKTPY